NCRAELLKRGEQITICEKSRKCEIIKNSLESAVRKTRPEYFEANIESYQGTLKSIPERDEIISTANEKLIVELYSK
ncbi:MAG: 30S ribosomal protein S4, partial [Deltaproteobacteria bacterium]|nr:30S ribosomal protein S4 [Deltaproteobacteria bacterium]